MSPPNETKYDDQLLVRYLLGVLPREETERLDELSVVDDDFASRLNAVENDLVDAFVKKELSTADTERFTTSYLSSPRRRQKLEFAKALLGFTPASGMQTAATPVASAPEVPAVPVAERPQKRFSLGWGAKLAFAGMSLALLLIAGYFSRENMKLRRTMSSEAARQDSLLNNQQRLEQELAQQRSTNADLQRQLDQAHSQPTLDQLKTVALLLPPPIRGASRIPTLTLAPGTDLALVSLTLDADEFPTYQVALKDASENRMVWHSNTLESSSTGSNKTVSVSFPAKLLKSQSYIMLLSGVSAKGNSESIGAYPFKVVLK